MGRATEAKAVWKKSFLFCTMHTPSNVENVLSLDDQLFQLGGHQSTKILCDYLTDFIREYFVFYSFIRIVQLFLKIENLPEQTS